MVSSSSSLNHYSENSGGEDSIDTFSNRSRIYNTNTFPLWLILFIVVVVISTTIPYVYYALTTPEDRIFSGSVENGFDQNVYFAWIEQVKSGRVLAHNLFTSEPHDGLLPPLPWLIVGWSARLLNVDSVYPFHMLRILAAAAYLLVVWLIIKEVLDDPLEQRLAITIVGAGAGLGFHAHVVNQLAGAQILRTADGIPELWGYHSVLVHPHFAVALAALSLSILSILRAPQETNYKWPITAFLSVALFTHIHPFMTMVLVPLLVMYGALLIINNERHALPTLIFGLLGVLPPVGLLSFYYLTNPIARAWASGAVWPSPSTTILLLGFGLIAPLAIVGSVCLIRQRKMSARAGLILGWAAIGTLAIYSGPLNPYERRCVEGLHIPLAFLAAIGVSRYLLPPLAAVLQSRRRAVTAAFVILALQFAPTNMGLQLRQMHNPGRTIPRSWVDAFKWIRANSAEGDVVLCDFVMANYVPRYSLRPVYAGHTDQTIDSEHKQAMIQFFFDEVTPTTLKLEILGASKCRYVIFEHRPTSDLLQSLPLEIRVTYDGIWIAEVTEPLPNAEA